MRTLRYGIILLLVLLVVQGFGQVYGKNKVQYKNFEWFYLQSKHFDVYYYAGGKDLAQFTAEVAEEAYKQLSRDLNFELRERVMIVVYNSHNDWQQTNVVNVYLDEGIGGVTELYKNRVVVPFEGSYEQFRHVIHHELVHAVMNDMIYGGNIQSLVRGEVVPLPLWVSEGLAEFFSTGWNTRTDMIVRDAMLTGYMPPVQYLEYVLAYQGGNSVFRYIAEKYGRPKIGEILNKSRGRLDFQNILKNTIGLDYEGLTEDWQMYLRKLYWPEVENREIPKEFSKQLTNHQKLNNFINLSPAITPQGDKIAYISDRSGTQNIYLMSALDGKEIKVLVKGQRSESFEELHFLRPGMSFSPDGSKLAFTAKSGPYDAIYIIDINTDEVEKHELKLNGAFTTSWSPDGKYIAFVGNQDNRSDLYLFEIGTAEIKRLTNDIFTDDQPSWSPDGRYLAFVSDRGDYASQEALPDDFKMSKYNYEFRDIYLYDLQERKITRVTNTPWEESFPIFTPDGEKLAFISDENGIYNIYFKDLKKGDYYPVTNVISGILQINWDKRANKLVFSSFYKGGYDIYVINNPLELQPKQLKPTKYVVEMRSGKIPPYARNWQPEESEKAKEEKRIKPVEGEQQVDYSRYTFGRYRARKERKSPREIEIPDDQLLDEEGYFKSRKYKIKFSPDFVTGSAGYNTFFGLQGYTSFAFSDLLGDHKIYLNTNLWADLRNSDFSLYYLNLKRRVNFGVGGYHLVYLFSDYYRGLIRYRNFGSLLTASYPFNLFKRLDFNLVWSNVFLEYMDFDYPTDKISAIYPEITFYSDNALWGVRWGVLAPVSGSRYAITTRISPKFNDSNLDFRTVKFDYRRYFMLSTKYQFAFRASAGASFGENAQRFYLGGTENWINRKFRGGRRVGSINEVFFSEFITPLRGAYYYERIGDRFFVTNWEFRFPLIEYLKLGFPPISLFNIRGVAFADIGSAWTNQSSDWWSLSSFQGAHKNEYGETEFKDLIAGYGFGARVYFMGFLLKWDVAWPYNLAGSGKPIHYWSLGLDF
ncbi:MAG: basic secretory protein-like protein [Calditrichia bacterium]